MTKASFAILAGYIPEATKKQAVSFVKGLARRRFKAIEESYYAVVKYRNGYIYEAHECGGGKSYLKSILALSKENSGTLYLPSGDRVLKVSFNNGNYAFFSLPEEQSKSVFNEIDFPKPNGKMYPLESNAVYSFSKFFFGISTACLIGVSAYSYYTPQYTPMITDKISNTLPHKQWNLVERTPTAYHYASKLSYINGKWGINFRNTKDQKNSDDLVVTPASNVSVEVPTYTENNNPSLSPKKQQGNVPPPPPPPPVVVMPPAVPPTGNAGIVPPMPPMPPSNGTMVPPVMNNQQNILPPVNPSVNPIDVPNPVKKDTEFKNQIPEKISDIRKTVPLPIEEIKKTEKAIEAIQNKPLEVSPTNNPKVMTQDKHEVHIASDLPVSNSLNNRFNMDGIEVSPLTVKNRNFNSDISFAIAMIEKDIRK